MATTVKGIRYTRQTRDGQTIYTIHAGSDVIGTVHKFDGMWHAVSERFWLCFRGETREIAVRQLVPTFRVYEEAERRRQARRQRERVSGR